MRQRPIRLCEETRKFAFDSQTGIYGRQAKETPFVVMDDVPGFAKMSPLAKHDAMIEKIVREAPIRICENEKISGSASLGAAISHIIPAMFDGKKVFDSISHLTIGYEDILHHGIEGLRKKAEASLAMQTEERKIHFVKSCIHAIDCFSLWHARYVKALEHDPRYRDNFRNLKQVPENPAQSFYEAVQSLWFTFAFTRLCGNWPGIGRIDILLGNYLKKDLAQGVLTINEAREILAHFFIKGCEWITGESCGNGDAQHYQNIVLSGIDENGEDVTNEVTYLVLDIIEELAISDFPITVRLNKNSDEKLVRRVAEVMCCGGGILAVYNEDLIIASLTEYGYDEKEARCFANDGCWEVQVPGKTHFGYYPFDALAVLQHHTLKGYTDVSFDSFEALYKKYTEDLDRQVQAVADFLPGWLHNDDPCTIVSLFVDDCIVTGKSYLEGGAVYDVLSPHIGGIVDTANSLYAMKKLVFDDKIVSFAELMQILKNNWEGQDALRLRAKNKYVYFGNDNDEADEMVSRVASDFADACGKYDTHEKIKFPPGISTFGRQVEWAPHRYATACGNRAGDVLSGNISPAPGTSMQGATAMIKSYCKVDLKQHRNGAALDVALMPDHVKGEEGVNAVMALLRGFVLLGGFFMQPDVVNAEILKEAQKNPESYTNLSVRVSGWSARFVTLNREWQDMVIAKNESGEL